MTTVLRARPPTQRPVRLNAIQRAAIAGEPAMRRSFRNAVAAARSGLDRDRLAMALQHNEPVAAFQWAAFQHGLQQVLDPVWQVMMRAGKAAGTDLRRRLPHRVHVLKQGPPTEPDSSFQAMLEFYLALKSPEAIRWANLQAARMVTNVSLETMLAIRAIIERAQREGLSVRMQAAEIAKLVDIGFGMNRPQATALMNFIAKLREDGLPQDRIDGLAAAKAESYIQARAELIARHETIMAAVAGQMAIWQQAANLGLIAADQKRQWVTAHDERVCPICGPMDGQTQPLNGAFRSPYKGGRFSVKQPPIHVACRCDLVLVLD